MPTSMNHPYPFCTDKRHSSNTINSTILSRNHLSPTTQEKKLYSTGFALKIYSFFFSFEIYSFFSLLQKQRDKKKGNPHRFLWDANPGNNLPLFTKPLPPQDKNSFNGNKKYRDSNFKKNLSCSLAFPLLRITTPEDKKTKRKKTPSSISNHEKIPNKINQSSNQASNPSINQSS